MSPIDTLLFLAGVFISLPIIYGLGQLFDRLHAIATRVLSTRRERRQQRRVDREFTKMVLHPASAGRCFVSGERR